MCINVFPYIYLCNMCMLGAQEGQRSWICFADPLELELQVLGIQPWSSARVASARNH